MAVSFSDLRLAFEFVSSGGIGENEAYLDRQSGKIYWHCCLLSARSADRGIFTSPGGSTGTIGKADIAAHFRPP